MRDAPVGAVSLSGASTTRPATPAVVSSTDPAPPAVAGPPGRPVASPPVPARRHLPGRRTATRLAGAVAAGAALALSFAPVSCWPAAMLGVALLAVTVRGCAPRPAAWLGLLAGLAFFVPLVSWAGTYVGPLPWLALATLEAAFFAAMAVALTWVWHAPVVAQPAGIAGVWVLQEGLRGRLPWGGFPWGRLGFAMPDAPAGHLASLGGVPLVTAAVALSGGLLALAAVRTVSMVPARATRRRPRSGATAAGALAVLAVLVAVVPVLLAFPAARGLSLSIAVIQGNVPRAGLDFNAQRRAVLDNHVQRTRELTERVRAGEVRRPDLVVWPENSSDVDPLTDASAAAEITEAADGIGVPVLVGAVLQAPDGKHLLNAGILWLPRTGPVPSYYVKQHPAPFGEYIPLRSVARVFSSAVDRVSKDFAGGTRVGTFPVSTAAGPVDLGDVICFEVGYDGLIRDTVRAGAQLLTVQTNNATFGHTAQSEQQLDMTRMRAIETGRWVMSASTSGISAVISPDGQAHQRTGLFRPAVLVQTVALSDARTPAVSLGLWSESVLATVGALIALWGCIRGRNALSRRTSTDRRQTQP